MKLKAYAKINLGLAVTAKRPDGFHTIDTLFARIAVHDTLEFKAQPLGIKLKVVGADLPEDRNNLVYLAAKRYLEQLDKPQGVSMLLEKRIPIAAGLGGGSSDAAAVLRALSQLYPADINVSRLAEDLGSDVSFFLKNVPAAHASGKGEVLTPQDLPELALVLVNPGIHVSAKEAYQNLKTLHEPLELDAIKQALTKGQELPYFNSLQAAVIEVYPDINNCLNVLKEAGLQSALMSGSGSSCFALARSLSHATSLAAKIKLEQPRWWVEATQLV